MNPRPTEPAQTNIKLWLDISQGVDHAAQINTWTDVTNAYVFTPTTTGPAWLEDAGEGFSGAAILADENLVGNINSSPLRHIFFSVRQGPIAGSGDVLLFTGLYDVIRVKQTGNTLTFTNVAGQTLAIDVININWHVVEILLNIDDDSLVTINLWDSNTRAIFGTLNFTAYESSGAEVDTITLGYVDTNGAQIVLNEIIGYEFPLSTADRNQTLAFIFNNTSNAISLSLPLVFPQCSQPVSNT